MAAAQCPGQSLAGYGQVGVLLAGSLLDSHLWKRRDVIRRRDSWGHTDGSNVLQRRSRRSAVTQLTVDFHLSELRRHERSPQPISHMRRMHPPLGLAEQREVDHARSETVPDHH